MPGRWTFDPLQLVLLTAGVVAYGRRAATLRARGRPVARWRIGVFATGVLVLVVAVVSPIHALGEEYLWWHMVQHLLLGDLAPLLVLAGLTGPLLRPLLGLGPLRHLRLLANPVVAFPLWTVIFLGWHLPVLYDAAVRYEVVHAFEHISFFAAGIVLWLPVLETLPAPEWFGTGAKLGYVVAVRTVGMALGNLFLWVAGGPIYDAYAAGHGPSGLSAGTDQSLAGAVMLAGGMCITLPLLVVLFLRLQQEAEARQSLLERGIDPRRARRAVRHRRWRAFAEPL